MEGIQLLDAAINNEFHLGLNNLPLSEFTHLFKHPAERILQRSLESKKSWFSTIRAGRIVYNDTLLQDGFSEKGPLQKWVGLSPSLFPSKREQKNIDTLNSAIETEMEIGIGDLPTSGYSQFFRQTTENIIALTLQKKKDWFTTVRGGRMTHKVNRVIDPFCKRGRLQQWVGL